MLERFMKLSICKDLKLDGQYTNHSIRATVISTLDREGFEGRHIIALSSHKSEATVKQYAPKCPENKCKEMFDSLSNAINPAKVQRIENALETPQKSTNDTPQDIMDVKQNLPNFNIQPIDEFDTIDDDLFAALVYNTNLTPTETVTEQVEIQPKNSTETAQGKSSIVTVLSGRLELGSWARVD